MSTENFQSLKTTYPKDQRENLAWRREILLRAKEDEGYRARVRELFDRDPLFAFNAFLWTYDPRKAPMHHQVFATWEYEDEFVLELVRAIDEGYDLLVEKSRDMGVTWTILGVYLWFWLKKSGGYDFLVGSRIEDYVDRKGDPRTHFERLRYILYRLPKWLRPRGFEHKRHDNFMKLVNPETGAAITGESNNPNFSTQGRYRSIMFDEFAKWENTDRAAWTAAGDATPSRIACSTPFGAGGQFYLLRLGGKVRVLNYHWSRHPEKSIGISCVWPPPNEEDRVSLGEHWAPQEKLVSPWYLKEVSRRGALEVAQELDIDYVGSGNPVFDGKAMDALKFYLSQPDDPAEWWKPDVVSNVLRRVSVDPEDWEGYLVVYEKPSTARRYCLGVDVVEGVQDGDYAVVVVYDRVTKGVSAVYWSKLDEVLLSKVIWLVSAHFGDPWVGIETTGPGLATFDLCVDMGMSNLFMAPRFDVINGGVTYKKGWRTDSNSRNELVSGIREWLIGRTGRPRSHRLIGECMSFVRGRTGKPEAKAGTYDDMVMAFGIAIQVDGIVPIDLNEVREARRELAADNWVVKDREEFRNDLPEPSLEERMWMDAVGRKALVAQEAEDLWDGVDWGGEEVWDY